MMNYGAVRLANAYVKGAYAQCARRDVPVLCDEILGPGTPVMNVVVTTAVPVAGAAGHDGRRGSGAAIAGR